MAGKHVGYMRVSSADQNTARQLEGISLDRVFEEKCSGKDRNRPQLTACLEYLREDDHLHVHSMDRLARNLVDLLSLVKELTGKGITVTFHKEKLTFTGEASPMQELQLAVMGAVAQFEREMIRERQREGIAVAKKEGRPLGRPSKLDDAQVEQLGQRAARGENKSKLAMEFGVSRETLYRLIRQREATRGGLVCSDLAQDRA